MARNLWRLKRCLIPFSRNAYSHTRSVCDSFSCLTVETSSVSPFFQNPTRTLPFTIFATPLSSQPAKDKPSCRLPLTRDGNYEEANDQAFPVCPGCGIHMQDIDREQPGYYVRPSNKGPNYKKFKKMTPIVDESKICESLKKGLVNELMEVERSDAADKVFDEMSYNVENAGISYERKEGGKPIVCARCHCLRHYQQVHNSVVENLLPDFDFDHTVGKRLASVRGSRSVVLLVVDVTDFDGSFPRKVANLVSKTIDENARSWKEGRPGNIPRVVLVVTKIDLLPSSISPTGLEYWVRTRARENGAGKLTTVHLVSAVKDWGVKTLVDDVVSFAGERGHVWAVGAQNAGKSTLINAIGKCVGVKATHLTEAPVPGTTLGIVKVEGLLPGRAKLFDTPGLLHPHQLSVRLTAEELKLTHITKELKPRTYRIKAGHSVHVGGLMRLDIQESSADSIYVTVWASPLLPLHMGKTENACTMFEEHVGNQLQPPIGKRRLEELGTWVKKEFRVSGNSWDSSSVDIAAAGLGWFAIGIKGEALFGIWTYEGVDLALRNALLPQRSHQFEVAGFTVSEIVSKADRAKSKKHQKEKKWKNIDSTEASFSSSSTLTIDAHSHSTNSITPTLPCSTPLSSDVHTTSDSVDSRVARAVSPSVSRVPQDPVLTN